MLGRISSDEEVLRVFWDLGGERAHLGLATRHHGDASPATHKLSDQSGSDS